MSGMLSKRSGGVAASAVVVLASVLAACGGGATATTSTVVDLSGTSYITLATTPPTAAPATADPGSTPAAGQQTTTVTEYKILATDNARVKVANKFGITVAELDAANVDTQGYNVFYPGLTIKIPAGATIPTETVAPPTPTTDPSATPAPTGPIVTVAGNGDGCQPGSYVITAADTSRTKVANKFNVTVAELDAANANTKGYSAFYPGLKIIIPPKSSCA